MIRINLLPSGKKKAVILPPSLIYGAISMVILIITISGVIFYLNGQITTLNSEVSAKEQKLAQLTIVLKKVANYEKDNAEYKQKTQIIEQLKKNQIIPLRLLDEVSDKLPQSVWITNLSDRSGLISIDGYAFSNSDLVGYVQNLKRSQYLTDVTLVVSKQATVEQTSVYNYKLTFRISL